jgi:hypothetical protein
VVAIADLLAWSSVVRQANYDDEAWILFERRVQEHASEVWDAIHTALEELSDSATWSDEERRKGEPDLVLDLSMVLEVLTKDPRLRADLASRSRTDDIVATAFAQPFWLGDARDLFRILGVEAVAHAWVRYQSGDTAWHWWAVDLVQRLTAPFEDTTDFSVDEGWELTKELARRCDDDSHFDNDDVPPLAMVGASPLENLFRRDPDRFLALVARDAPTNRHLRRALREVWADPENRQPWQALSDLLDQFDRHD